MKSKKASKVEAKIDDITNRSQLLHRLVQSCFGYTYHNGIELNRYFPISFTVNWTYCWSLHIRQEEQLSEQSPTISKEIHQTDVQMFSLPAILRVMVGFSNVQPLPQHPFLSCLQQPEVKTQDERVQKQRSWENITITMRIQ